MQTTSYAQGHPGCSVNPLAGWGLGPDPLGPPSGPSRITQTYSHLAAHFLVMTVAVVSMFVIGVEQRHSHLEATAAGWAVAKTRPHRSEARPDWHPEGASRPSLCGQMHLLCLLLHLPLDVLFGNLWLRWLGIAKKETALSPALLKNIHAGARHGLTCHTYELKTQGLHACVRACVHERVCFCYCRHSVGKRYR